MKENKLLFMGANAQNEREKYDYYATEPRAADDLLSKEDFNNIWECACGEGHLSKRFIENGKKVYSSDIVDRGYGDVKDFLCIENQAWNGDIITNPPFKYAQDFVEKALSIIPDNNKVAMFLKIQFLESKKRKQLFKKYPPKKIYVYSERINTVRNGNFKDFKSSTMLFAWFVWEKGLYTKTEIDWI
jgi:23S rRNA A2030 N6-methylase RlmJ|tara:strand:+ start:2994 stop:3554 length:561 start_codon:yes stop_codon:yes gene_type:complete